MGKQIDSDLSVKELKNGYIPFGQVEVRDSFIRHRVVTECWRNVEVR